ncbi:EAL domain-containing protein [Legionella geestiana]|uniref:EAL domain-containing protein n=1 Tax=Legionella geestiana TaxID=45065 RepID=UPI001092F330|nr:EAL domain-containing protein [Legionella geestiana]QDQ40143.1 EAL domain-containing protein [Legionella geestiana]
MEYSRDVAKVLTKQIDELSMERNRLIENIAEFRNILHGHPCAFLDYVEKVDNPFYEISADLTKIIYVNAATEKMFGMTRDALYEDANKWFNAVHPDDRGRVKEYLSNLDIKNKAATGFEYKMIKSDGSIVYVQDFAVLSNENDGEQHSIVGFVVDITKHVKIQKNKFVYEQIINAIRFTRSIEQTMDVIIKTACISMAWDEAEIWVYDSQATSFYCISVYHKLTEEIAEYYQMATSLIIDADTDFQGYVIRNNKPTLILDLARQNEVFNTSIARRHKISTALGIPIICHEKPIGVLTFYNQNQKNCEQSEIDTLEWMAGILGGIIQHNLSNQKLQYITSHNDLTGLLNRNGLEVYLNTLITQNESDMHGIIMLDISRFKLINETYNFEIGDILLRQIALKFQETLNDTTRIIANLGGDIFAFVVPKLKTSEALKPIIDKILVCLQRPFEIKNNLIYLQASIGVSIYPYDGLDIMTLLKKSDIALKHAKSRGGSSIQFSTQALQQSVSNALRIENGLRRALVDNQFRLHYQPKVDLRTGKMVGLEALIRWNDPQNGLQYPDAFLHIAQHSDLIIYIGEWVFLRLAYHLPLMDFRIPIAINMDARQLKREYDFVGFISQLIKKMSIPTELLELEVTEAEIMHDATQAAHVIQSLQKTGISIAIDDFGSGY